MTLALADVSLTLGAFSLHDIRFRVADGEILAILGPNGAGKSVTLETIAGFYRPRSGRVSIAGHDVTALPPERRAVGLVPQSYGLFPHMSVARNVALGLRAAAGRRGHDMCEVGDLLARFGIARLAGRLPRELSPGERQRTALARTLAMRPRAFLFDEPFAALDARLRETLREELGAFLREAKVPTVFVTHDQTDVTALADRVAVMRDGTILQEGPVEDVFRAPRSRFVAEFVGVENRLTARLVAREGENVSAAVGEQRLTAPAGALGPEPGHEVCLCIRGEDIALYAAPPGAHEPRPRRPNLFVMRIARVISLGALSKVVLEGDFPLIACPTSRSLRALGLAAGADAWVEIEPAAIHLVAAS